MVIPSRIFPRVFTSQYSITMAANVPLKLFPSGWFHDMSESELEEARAQLRAYAMSKELDVGLSEVYVLLFSICKGNLECGKPLSSENISQEGSKVRLRKPHVKTQMVCEVCKSKASSRLNVLAKKATFKTQTVCKVAKVRPK